MSQIRGRECLSRIEDYVVETVPDADIIVNANETNEPMGKKMEKKLDERCPLGSVEPLPLHARGRPVCFSWKEYGLDLTCSAWNGSSELLEKVCFAFGGKGRKIAYPAPSFSCTKRISPYLTARPYRIVWMRSLR